MKKYTLIILLITPMLISMQRPAPSLVDLCCTKLGKYYAKNIDEITPETGAGNYNT